MKRILPLFFALLFLLAGCADHTDPAPIAAVSPDAVPETEEAIVVITPAPTPTPLPLVAYTLPSTSRVRRGFTVTEQKSVLRRDADGSCFVYGSPDGSAPAFYPCDETGTVPGDAVPTDVICVVPLYTPTDEPKSDGQHLLVVYLGSQAVVAYESQDGEWIQQRVMICSTGRRKGATPVGTFKIYDSFPYKELGTSGAHCFGLWACRFKTHHLFHSVPISFNAGRDPEKGHRMCDMHKYQMLGSVASDGCVRLTVLDAKWIYDLYNKGAVKIAVRVVNDRGPTPERPPAVIWTEPYTDKKGYGWDPTDPDPNNPYLLLPEYLDYQNRAG